MNVRHALLVVNPISGKNAALRHLPLVRQELAAHGVRVSVVETQLPGDGERAVRAAVAAMADPQGGDVLVAVGGDGTLAEVVRGMGDTRVPVAVIPMGTGNLVARELGIPREVRAACRLIVKGRPRAIDLVRTPRGAFLAVAGAGFDAQVVENFARTRKGRVRKRSYIRPVFETLRRSRFPRFAVEIDDRVVTRYATSAIVGNMRTYGGPFCLTPRARPDDGVLDVCVFRARLGIEYACCFSGATLGLHTFLPGVTYHRGRKVVLRGGGDVPVHLDGDPCGGLPISFEAVRKAVRIIAP